MTYPYWQDELTRLMAGQTTILCLAMIAFVGALALIELRYFLPRLLPIARRVGLTVFVVSLVAVTVITIL